MGWAAVAAMLVMLEGGRAVPPALHGRVLIPTPPPPPPPPPLPRPPIRLRLLLYLHTIYLHTIPTRRVNIKGNSGDRPATDKESGSGEPHREGSGDDGVGLVFCLFRGTYRA